MSPGFATSTGAWDEEAPDVFILGAGISLAVDLSFPDTDTLGTRALDKISQANRLGIDLSIRPEQVNLPALTDGASGSVCLVGVS
ncbi:MULTISPECIES: hypothetical protein [Acidithrix]|uniref:Uncharacterized protein n=1 Tax=Acidithrix ferrooxidans TaxID=1280514 RepID=A0A0D8HCH1_9ACTN|nr:MULTISPECIES: hypothetical protein [Acidithrix]KJF15487.1 hypothetical protein AXFE_36600 [Acidithrix ferrooxidans]